MLPVTEVAGASIVAEDPFTVSAPAALIATRFKDYDEHLIFESMNEEFDGTYGDPNRTHYENINTYNQIFVDTVRQTGGNNDKRDRKSVV